MPTRKELLSLAKSRGLKKLSKLSKPDLMELIDNDIKERPDFKPEPESAGSPTPAPSPEPSPSPEVDHQNAGHDDVDFKTPLVAPPTSTSKKTKRAPNKYNLFLKERMAKEGITFRQAMETSSELWKAHKAAQAQKA